MLFLLAGITQFKKHYGFAAHYTNFDRLLKIFI